MSTDKERKLAMQRMSAPVVTIRRLAKDQPAHEGDSYVPTYDAEKPPTKKLLIQNITLRSFNLHQSSRALFNVALDRSMTYDKVKNEVVNKDDIIVLKDAPHEFYWTGIVTKVEPHSADSAGNHFAQVTVDGMESIVSRASLCYGRYYPSFSTNNYFVKNTSVDENFKPTNTPNLSVTSSSSSAVGFASARPLKFNDMNDPSTFRTWGTVTINMFGQAYTTPLFASGPSLPEQAADPVYRRTPKTKLWRVRDVMCYIMALHNRMPLILQNTQHLDTGAYVWPDGEESALNKTCEPLSLEGMSLIEALGRIGEVNHLVISPYYSYDTTTQAVKVSIDFIRWGLGSPNQLYLQKRGETAVRHKDADDNRGSDLQTYRLVEDTSDAVSFPVVLGGATYIDNTTIELMPGWDWRDMVVPSTTNPGAVPDIVLDSNSPDAPLPAASLQQLFNYGLDLQANQANTQGFRWADKHMPYGRQYSSFGHVGRLWVANEGGNYRHLSDLENNPVIPNFQALWMGVKGFSTSDARCIRNRKTQNPYVRNARDKTWEGVRQPPLLEVCFNYYKTDNLANPSITSDENKSPDFGRKWLRLDHWNDIGFSVRDDQIAVWLEMSDPLLFGTGSITVMLGQSNISKYILQDSLRTSTDDLLLPGRTSESDPKQYLDGRTGYGTLFWYRLMAEAYRMQHRGIISSGGHQIDKSQIRLRVTLAVETDRRFRGVVAPFNGGTAWPTQKLYSRPNMVQTLNGGGQFNTLAKEVVITSQVTQAESEAQALMTQIVDTQTAIRRGGTDAVVNALQQQLNTLTEQYGAAVIALSTLRSQVLGVPLMIHQDDSAILQRSTQFVCRSEQTTKVIMGQAYLPDWRMDYHLGQTIDKIVGRDIDLSRNTPEGRFCGNIMQITYVGGPNMGANGGNDTRATELVLSYPDLSAWVV